MNIGIKRLDLRRDTASQPFKLQKTATTSRHSGVLECRNLKCTHFIFRRVDDPVHYSGVMSTLMITLNKLISQIVDGVSTKHNLVAAIDLQCAGILGRVLKCRNGTSWPTTSAVGFGDRSKVPARSRLRCAGSSGPPPASLHHHRGP